MTSHAIAPLKPPALALFLRRIWGLMLRHYYLHVGSWPRIVEMLYWPIVNMVTWGFTSRFVLQKFTDSIVVSSSMVAGVLLVEVFVRVNINMLLLFLEEVWSRNLGHLFVSPLKFSEYIFGAIIVCLIRTSIAMLPAIFLAQWLFHFSLFGLGTPVVAYILLLAINGCWYGSLTISMLLRFGLGAEWMAWMGTWLIIPLVAPYYPVSVLPQLVQPISYALPATYVFEAMKMQMNGMPVPADKLWTALILNIFYFIVAGFILRATYRGAKARGGLLQVGE